MFPLTHALGKRTGGPDMIIGANGLRRWDSDKIGGGDCDDTINGGDENDIIIGRRGNQYDQWRPGHDVVFLGSGNDTFSGTRAMEATP